MNALSCCTATLVLLTGAAVTTHAQPTPGAETRASSGQFTIYKLQHAVGVESYQIVQSDTTRQLATHWSFRYLGTPVELTDTLITTATGEPRRFRAHGQTSTLTDVNLDVSVQGERPPFFVSHSYLPAAVEEALFLEWQTAGRPRTLRLIPHGRASFEYRGDDTLTIANRTEVVRRYAVRGLLWGVQSMWATADDRRLVAVINGDAELDRFEEIRDGYGDALPQFARASVRDGIAAMREATRDVRPLRDGTYALVGARVIDGTGAPPIDDATIIVRAGKLSAIGPRARVSIPSGVPKVEVTGKTIIPGLWDMHVHFEQVEWPAAQLAAGVTTARDVGNEQELATGLRDAIRSGALIGPRMLLAGLIDGAPDGLGVHLAASDSDARARVREYHDAGYDQIKIYQSVPPAIVPAITQEAHRLGMTVTGHVPTGMNAFQFVEAGADQINHFGFILAVMRPPVPRGTPRPPLNLESDSAKAAIEFFRAHGTVLDPTLARAEQGAHSKESPFSDYEPGLEKAPPELQDAINASGLPADRAIPAMARFTAALPVVEALRQSGVPVLAGTDLVVPGYSMFRELELEVKAGFSPMQAIQSATLVPARVMKRDAESGTIEAGKRADLVILDADPLADISNMRRVHAVVTAGRMFDPAPLWHAAGFIP